MPSPNLIIPRLILSISLCLGAVPKWFIKPNDDHQIITGIGSARNPKDAKINALNDLASSISIMIQSQTSLRQERDKNKLDSSLTQDINLYIKDLHLLGVNTLQSEEHDGIFYIRLGIQKQNLIKQFRTQIEQNLNKINALNLKQCQSLDLFKFHTLDRLLKQTNSKIMILNALDDQTHSYLALQKAYDIFYHNSPKPYAHAIFEGLDSALISSLQKELTKFFELKPTTSSNLITFKLTKDGLNITFKDCKSDILFNDQIDSALLPRANFIFYKKVKAYLNRE